MQNADRVGEHSVLAIDSDFRFQILRAQRGEKLTYWIEFENAECEASSLETTVYPPQNTDCEGSDC